MIEKLLPGSESLTEKIDLTAESERNLERIHEAAKQSEREPTKTQIESLEKSVKAESVSGKEFNIGDKQAESSNQTFGVDKALKSDSYKRSLRKIRSSLPAPERTFSRVIHNKTIESVSNAAAKTVARPSAFLGGSIGALIGSGLLFYMARQYGFTYNYTFFIVMFAGGFAAGLLIELILRFLFKRKTF